jgi:hypothetical protein
VGIGHSSRFDHNREIVGRWREIEFTEDRNHTDNEHTILALSARFTTTSNTHSIRSSLEERSDIPPSLIRSIRVYPLDHLSHLKIDDSRVGISVTVILDQQFSSFVLVAVCDVPSW